MEGEWVGFKGAGGGVAEAAFGLPHLRAQASRPKLVWFGVEYAEEVVIFQSKNYSAIISQDICL